MNILMDKLSKHYKQYSSTSNYSITLNHKMLLLIIDPNQNYLYQKAHLNLSSIVQYLLHHQSYYY